MNVAILGVKGMLGTDLVAACGAAGIAVKGYDLPEVDITRDDGGLEGIGRVDWVINCAAYTDVDGAERDQAKAQAVNGEGVGRIAGVCRKTGAALLHISTDYVFDGTSRTAYCEEATVNPLNVYGQSKLAGEKAVLAAGIRHLVVRTQSLFGVHGKNFVKAIMARLEQGEPLRVVNDQVSSPTYTVHLAAAILRLLNVEKDGIVHVSATGACSWYEFARAIAARVRPGASVAPVTSDEFKRPARRPANSVLDKGRYRAWTGQELPTWEEGLDAYLKQL